jgi:deoxycytidylate deaminase
MFSKQQLKLFERAAQVADDSQFDVFHVGCIAVLKNKIIAASANKLNTHPTQAIYDKYRFSDTGYLKNMHTLHAEIACISQIKQDIVYKDLELYIVRLKKSGGYGMARPCSSCMPFIIDKGIQKIYYSTNYGFASEVISGNKSLF